MQTGRQFFLKGFPMSVCKREFPRVNVSFPVEYEVVKWKEAPHHPKSGMKAECHDLSIRGIRFEHDLDLDEKILKKMREGVLKLNLEFTLPEDNRPINLLGRVVYCGEDETDEPDDEENDGIIQCMRVVFVDIKSSDYEKISKFIQDHSSN